MHKFVPAFHFWSNEDAALIEKPVDLFEYQFSFDKNEFSGFPDFKFTNAVEIQQGILEKVEKFENLLNFNHILILSTYFE